LQFNTNKTRTRAAASWLVENLPCLRLECEFPKISCEMKKIVFSFFISVAFALSAFAQPTFRLSPQQQVLDEGEQVCLTLQVDNFTDILSVSFSIAWDAGVLEFDQITNLNSQVTGLDINDFDVSMADDGIITFDWNNGQPCSTGTTGVTLFPDGQVMFNICFTATGVYGNHTPVEITDAPKDIVIKRVSSNCNDIGDFIQNAFVSIGTPPLTINVSSGDGFTGDVVCLDFKVEDFDNIVSFQFAVYWDTAVLKYNSALTMGLTGNYFLGETQTAQGNLNLLYYNANVNTGVTLPDGTQILQICFEIVGDCGQVSPVYISGNGPGSIEVINSVTSNPTSGVNIGLLQQEGEVTVNCFNPNGINMTIDDKSVCPGENFTVDVRVSEFTSIAKLMFNLKWNPGVLDLTNVTYPQNAPCTPFSSGVSLPSDGLLKMDWASFGLGCTLPDNFILMRLHFSATGSSSTSSTIAVVNPILVDKFGGQVVNIGINNSNGLVTLCELSQPTIYASSTTALPGDTVCVDFRVQDFEDITTAQFTINWEPSILEFVGVNNLGLPDLSNSNFLTSQALSIGALGVDWESATAVDKPDASTIFSICFKVIGDPDLCSDVSITDVPWPVNIETSASNNTNVGLNGQGGTVCVDNPFIFEVQFPDVYAGSGSSTCVDVKVKNFIQLTRTRYTINWNPEILEYAGVTLTGNLPNFSAASYDQSPVYIDNGQLVIDWKSSNQIQGTTLADGTSIFQLCFEVVGPSGACSQLSASGFPVSIEVNSALTGAANLGLGPVAGSVCVSSVLILQDAVITPVLCPNIPSGAIDLEIVGGSGSYAYSWSGPNVNTTSEDQSNLPAGNYFVTVEDEENAALVLELELEVGYSAQSTLASAGVDTSFSCADYPFITLNGLNSIVPVGDSLHIMWIPALGSGIVTQGQGTLTPKVLGGSCWKLTLTNITTGCVHSDTVCVSAPVYPVPEAGPESTITCANDTVNLDGSLSPVGFTASWSFGPGGGNLVPGTENQLVAKATAPGWYYLTQTSPASGCQGTDSVYVDIDVVEPVSDAGVSDGLGCNDVSVPVGGTGSSTGAEFTYQWNALVGGEICGNASAPQTSVCSPGTYQLVVTNTLNGCTAQSQVQVAADTLKPIAIAGPSPTITCLVPQVTLNGAGSSIGANYEYQWTGGTIVNGQGSLNPTVSAAGTYTLEVTDTTNGCKAFSSVVVAANNQPPQAVASASNPITCLLDQSTLSAAGSASGSAISYQWLDNTQTQISTSTTLSVATPGVYTLIVSNAQNGCTQTTTVQVADNSSPPAIDAGPDQNITCYGNPQLQGDLPANPNIILNWSGPGLGCIQGNGTATPTVSCPGTYTLTVQDTATGCVNTSQVVVTNDKTPPAISAGNDTTLTCAVTAITLPATSDVADITVTWTSVPANLPIVNPGSLNPSISAAGTYTLQVTNNVNGCTKTDFVVVGTDLALPVADAGAADTTDCLNTLGNLSAAGSTLSNTTITWTALAGSIDPSLVNQVSIVVPAGLYELAVMNDQNGCVSKDTVEVTDNAIAPLISTAETVELGCLSQTVTLDASNSQAGSSISYTWTDAQGNVLSNSSSLEVSEVGVYNFSVFNADNNCENSVAVAVLAASDGPPASAAADYELCDAAAFLTGNLPAGTTGSWTSTTGAIFDDEESASTQASNLQTGTNIFIWSLSLGSCVDYDADTVSIEVTSAPPVAEDDFMNLAGSEQSATVNILDNDVFDDATYQLIPSAGQPKTLNLQGDGQLTYGREKCRAGVIEVPYEICDNSCPGLCDTALVIITVEADPSADCDFVPNGITPNGDGLNDELVFDILLNNPASEFPDNEIIIFNRWGDVVYQAKPYNNDWRGTNQSGNELPQGTYYYILRLSLADGEILRGDITILK
jgi:gliding motility-associated-like protein